MKNRKIKSLAIISLIFICIFLIAKTYDVPFIGIDSKKFVEWSIGIYKLYIDGDDVKAVPHPQAKNPVLTARDVTDRKSQFVADPFLIYKDGTYYMFFESLDRVNDKDNGDIALATSKDGIKWRYQQIVLDEPFHLSYPLVFEWQGAYYMLPQSSKTDSVGLYKASSFPYEWKFVKDLVVGKKFVDSTILYFQDRWWLFTSTSDTDTLYLYYASELEGPWIEHPKSPILRENKHITRHAGNILNINGKLIRLAQEGFPSYGRLVRGFEILTLTPEEYKEQELKSNPIVQNSGYGWNKDGMHQISSYQVNEKEWLASVDGKAIKKQYYFYFDIPEFLNKFLSLFISDK